jgi:hypothetical protein
MDEYAIASFADGVDGLTALTELLTVTGAPPNPAPFTPYQQNVGSDLNGAPIWAGLPSARWEWTALPRTDFETLLNFCPNGSALVFISTRRNDGTFANFLALMKQPIADAPSLSLRKNVAIEFVNLIEQT